MLAVSRHLLRPKGVVKANTTKFAFLEFQEGNATKTAVAISWKADKTLAERSVAFTTAPSPKDANKPEARGVRLCDAAEATGTLKFYDSIRGYGAVVGKDGKRLMVHHSQVTDLGNIPTKLKKGDAVEFDVEPGEKGPRARNLRRAP